MRRTTSSTSASLKSAGAVRVGIVDGQRHLGVVAGGPVPRAGEDHVVHADAAHALAEFAPITQRSASSRFDLPQPFGPTTPVSPGSIRNLGRLDEGLEAREGEDG